MSSISSNLLAILPLSLVAFLDAMILVPDTLSHLIDTVTASLIFIREYLARSSRRRGRLQREADLLHFFVFFAFGFFVVARSLAYRCLPPN